MQPRVEQILEQLKERDFDNIEREKRQVEHAHEYVQQVLTRTSELTGIDEVMILRMVGRVAAMNVDLPWYRVLDLFKSLYLAKNNLEEDNKGR